VTVGLVTPPAMAQGEWARFTEPGGWFLAFALQILTVGTETKVPPPSPALPSALEGTKCGLPYPLHPLLPRSPFKVNRVSAPSPLFHCLPPPLLTLSQQAGPHGPPTDSLGYIRFQSQGCENVKSHSLLFLGPMPTSSFLKLL
jgi:hypothetical protein